MQPALRPLAPQPTLQVQAYAPAHAQTQSQVQKQQRQKRQRTERRLPSKLDTVVPESRLYTDMVQLEKKVDAVLLRKWLEREEALRRPPRVRRTLRIFLSNLAANQPHLLSESDYEALDTVTIQDVVQPPSWTLRIEGRLLEPTLTAVAASGSRRPPVTARFSQLIKRLIVELDRDPMLYPDGNLIEWVPTVDHAPVDGFEIKRLGDQSVNARILLELNHSPPRFKVLQPLAQAIMVHTDTRPAILAALYQYIRARKLQKPDDRSIIVFDEVLQHAFGVEAARFSDLPDLMVRQLTQPDPIVLPYTIRTETDFYMLHKAFDIEFDMPDTFGGMGAQTFSEAEARDLAKLDNDISMRIQSVQQARLKREFMLAFAASPVYFIHAWLDAQARDQKTVVGDTAISVDEQRHTGLFSQAWVNEAVAHYLSDVSAKRTEELMKQVQQGTAHF